MNESEIIDFETFEKEKEIKEKAKNIIKISLSLSDLNYILRLYLSEEKNSIIFKLEKERDLSYFYFEKFFLNDFRQKSRIFMIDYSITQILSHMKKLIVKSEIVLEKKEENNMIVIIKSELDKYELKFDLKKIILAQNQLNPKLVEQIQENKTIINILEKQILRMNKIVQEKNDLINDLKSKKENIVKTINDINTSINNNTTNTNIQNNNNNKDEEKNVNETKKTEKKEGKEGKEGKEEITKKPETTSTQNKKQYNNNEEKDDKRYYNNNIKKKNKKKNKKYYHGGDQNKNNKNNNNNKNPDDNSIFCFENVEIIGNKKIFELLVVFNVIMILIILCLIGSIYSIKSNLEYEKVFEDEFMNKLSYLNLYNEYGDDEYGLESKDLLLENDLQKGYFKDEIISREKNSNIKDIEFILKYKSSRDTKSFEVFKNKCKGVEDNLILIKNDKSIKFGLLTKNLVEILKKNKIKEKDMQKIKKNFVMYNVNKYDIFEYNFRNNFEQIYSYLVKIIIGFLNDKRIFEENGFTFIGRIIEIEIYELKYIK